MNNSMSALLAALSIDLNVFASHAEFYATRNEASYLAGTHGPGVAGPFGMTVYAADYESPNCPEGWDTLPGFMARWEPIALACMDQTPEAFDGDEKMLAQLCQQRGISPTKVLPSSWAVRCGVFEALAFPVNVLWAHAGIRAD